VEEIIAMRLTKHISLVGGGRFGLSNPYDCSIYALDFAEGVLLVDSGCGLEPERIEANLQVDGINLDRVRAIVLTHAHADHAGGCKWWKDRTGCQVYAPEGERGAIEGTDAASAHVLETAKQAGIYPADYILSSVKVDVGVQDGDDVGFGTSQLHAIEIAGHSAHHTCYWTDMDGCRAFFSGDAVLYGGSLLLQNIPGCSLDEYRRDIDKLAGLDADILLPGHGIFVMRHAQTHLNRAVEALHGLAIPPNFAVLCPKVIS
jgi:hydroxyacylglutathione hydrolase